uniref:CVNH domain-containing protein n=1 Tax=Syphacia muris TaxID=451379 RepID=A0A0N5AEE4_9BILA
MHINCLLKYALAASFWSVTVVAGSGLTVACPEGTGLMDGRCYKAKESNSIISDVTECGMAKAIDCDCKKWMPVLGTF